MLPLYPDLVRFAGAPERQESANAGLVHQKYADSWTADCRKHDDAAWKAFLDRVRKLPAGAAGLLAEYHERRRTLADRIGGQAWRGKSLWRLVAGMGGPNAREIGFSWDFRLGVPRLPGSSLKGAVRSWAEVCLDPPQDEAVTRIFGPRHGSEAAGAGTVIFFDAYPSTAAALDLDVMTVHYQSYYGGAGDPNGMDGPNPLLFLAAPPNTGWITYLAPRRPENAADVELAYGWLSRCASEWGLGAKTSVGYGYLTPEPRQVTWTGCRAEQPDRRADVTFHHTSGTASARRDTWRDHLSHAGIALTEEQTTALRGGRLLVSVRVQQEESGWRYLGLEAVTGIAEAEEPVDPTVVLRDLLEWLSASERPVTEFRERAAAIPELPEELFFQVDREVMLSDEGEARLAELRLQAGEE